MRNKIIKTMAFILTFVLSLSIFSGCSLIQVNNERDMNQVVATVQVDSNAPLDEITKKEVIIMYINYGYTYVESYGYTMEQAIELIVDSLLSNRILVQEACVKMFNNMTAEEQAKIDDVYDVDNYLTTEELEEALYTTTKSFNDLIDNYVEDDEEEDEVEDYSITSRSYPTGAQTEEEKEELTYEDHLEYNAEGVITGYDDVNDYSRITAYSDMLDALKLNSLLDEDFDYKTDDVTQSEYFLDNLKSNKETILIANYEEVIRQEALAKVTFAQLEERYANMYNTQMNTYTTPSAYATALSSADGDTTRVVYNPYEGYGYVYNILLSLDSVQQAELDDLTARYADDDEGMTEAEYQAERESIFAQITAKDLRSSWVVNNYDYDMDTKMFGEDFSSYPFQGEVSHLNADEVDDEDYEAEYKVTSLKEFSMTEFMQAFNEYVYDNGNLNYQSETYFAEYQTSIESGDKQDFIDKVEDMMFAFSTDPGSLTSINGYVSYPVANTPVGETETYVQEFADAARAVVEEGTGSYKVVATDYGYHVIICKEKIEVNSSYPTLVEYLNSLGMTEDEAVELFEKFATTKEDDLTDEEKETYLYKFYALVTESLISQEQTDAQNEMIKKYMDDENYVVVYTERYEDLFDL